MYNRILNYSKQIGRTEICQKNVYVVAIPYATNAYKNFALGEKSAFLGGWLIIVLVFSAMRYILGGNRYLATIVIDTIARSLGVSAGNPQPVGHEYKMHFSRSVLLTALNGFAITFSSYYSSYLFTQHLVRVTGAKRIQFYEELLNDTLKITVPVEIFLFMSTEIRKL